MVEKLMVYKLFTKLRVGMLYSWVKKLIHKYLSMVKEEL